jgi:hypothetical protein
MMVPAKIVDYVSYHYTRDKDRIPPSLKKGFMGWQKVPLMMELIGPIATNGTAATKI